MNFCMTELADNNANSYAKFLKSKGKKVFELGGVAWMKYHGALISASAMPVYVDLTCEEAVQMVKESKALFLRYTTGPMTSPTNWWNMICRDYDFNKLSPSTRSKIRRGMHRHEIKQVGPEWLVKKGYECYVKCYSRYKHAMPKSRSEYDSILHGLIGQSLFDIWACTKNKELKGYVVCIVEKSGVFMHTIDITPAGLHDYAAYATIHQLLEYYVNKKKLPVSNGSRSISHETNIQDFLQKLGFEREYSELHAIYRPDVKIVVELLYPFRNIINKFNNFSLFHKMSSVLFQEEIIRNNKNAY